MAVQTHVPDRVRELRACGYSPKQIAKTLDLRPAVAARLVRMLAAEEAAAAPEPAVVGCWVSPGWSAHLTVDGPADWADVPPPEDGMTGLAAAVVARRHRPQRVSVCGYLVDTFCLGVKNTLGPELPRVVVGAGHVGRYAAAEPRSHRGGPLVTGLRALFAIAVFLSVVCALLHNEFGLAGAVVGGAAVGLLSCLITPWASRRRR